MITVEPDSEQEFRVVVSAIVGGPFDVLEGTVLTRDQLGEWEEPLLRRGAIVKNDIYNDIKDDE